MKRYYWLFAFVVLLPLPAFAVGDQLEAIISFVLRMITVYLIPIALALALLFFIWGLAIFIKNSGSEDAIKEGRQKMIWGIITLFVIVAIWGIVRFVVNVTGVRQTGPFPAPGVPGSASTGGRYDTGNYSSGSGQPSRTQVGTQQRSDGGSVEYFLEPTSPVDNSWQNSP